VNFIGYICNTNPLFQNNLTFMPNVKSNFLTLFFLSFMFLLTGCTGKPKENSASGKGAKPISVLGVVIRPGVLDNKIQATGSLMANEEVELRSELPGRIVSINFEEGSYVDKGDLLMKTDDRELQAQLKKLRVDEKQAGDDLYRKEKLLELKAVSQEEYDRASTTLGIIQAQVELVQTQISKSAIYAPFGGQIGLRQVSPGGFVSSATLIARLQQIDPVKVEFAIPEKYRNKIGKGTLIRFSVEGIDSSFIGRVYAIDPKIDPGTRNISMRAICANPRNILVPGAFARVEILLEHLTDAIVIPSEAIVPQMNGEKVFVSRGGKAVSQIIRTGFRTEREVQITAGLSVGDTLITTGLLQLREEMPVIIRLK
jgi:membrane fusion protein (multidrug efflux system)